MKDNVTNAKNNGSHTLLAEEYSCRFIYSDARTSFFTNRYNRLGFHLNGLLLGEVEHVLAVSLNTLILLFRAHDDLVELT